MKESFSNNLLQFIDSVDILEESHLKQLVSIIKQYVKKVLNINHIKIMHTSNSMNSSGTSLHGLFKKETIPLDNDLQDKGQMPFAFIKAQPLWILPSSKDETLNTTKHYIDKWSSHTNLPRYKTFKSDSKSKTSIIIPLFHDFRQKEKVGIINFESDEYIEPTQIAKETLKNISKVISKAIRLKIIKEQFQETTTKTLKKLNSQIEDISLKLTKPKIFLGYPDTAEDEVIGTIKSLLDELYGTQILLCDWKTDSTPGPISQKLFEDIQQSAYGIFYFSEKDKNNPNRYTDNKNVIFEAGLFHGKKNPNWILIREEASEETPFDIADLRTLHIERNSEGAIQKENFRVELKKMLNSIIEI